MTSEGRTTLAVSAVLISVAIHALLMEFIAPCAMQTVSTARRGEAAQNRRIVTVREEQLPAESFDPPAVDVPPPREAPRPPDETAAPPPAAPGFSATAPDALQGMAASAAPAPDMPMPSAFEPAPAMSSVAAAGKSRPEVLVYQGSDFQISALTTTPAAPRVSEVAPSFPAPAAVPRDVGALPPEPAPAAFAAMPPPASLAPSAIAMEKEAGGAKSEYVFENKVLPGVDEKTVEAEKTAVRALLEAPSAKPFPSDVVCEFSHGLDPADPAWRVFRIAFSVKAESLLPIVPKDMVILFDASGSIANDRLKSCREVARRMLRTCSNSGDRFNLVAFRDKFEYAFDSWMPCDAQSFDSADRWLSSLVAHGRTDIFSSIRSVLSLPRDPARPVVALVVTDGDANTGVHRTSEILSKFTKLNGGLVSVYMYGVKSSANRKLLDYLTHGNRGESHVHEGFRWRAGAALEELAGSFRDPVFSDVSVTFADSEAVEAHPRLLRNLCKGRVVELYGRCPASRKELLFSLRALSGRENHESFYRMPVSGTAVSRELAEKFSAERAMAL